MQSRHWLMACGLEASIEGIGNVYGRHPGAGPQLLVGSHIDPQNEAGGSRGPCTQVEGSAIHVALWLIKSIPIFTA
jgi:N-carbamoyl-L-amino-acid hydrolase